MSSSTHSCFILQTTIISTARVTVASCGSETPSTFKHVQLMSKGCGKRCKNAVIAELYAIAPKKATAGPFYLGESSLAASILIKVISRKATMLTCLQFCQRKAWKSHHKAECKIFAEEHIEDVTIRAIIRLLCMRKLGTLNDNQWHWVNKMQSHVEYYDQSDPELGRTISDAASAILDWTGMGGSEENISELFCRVSSTERRCLFASVMTREYTDKFEPHGRRSNGGRNSGHHFGPSCSRDEPFLRPKRVLHS